MRNYVVHNAAGAILRSISVPTEAEAEAQLTDGESLAPNPDPSVRLSWRTHRVVRGKLTELKKPHVSPGEGYVFDHVEYKWVKREGPLSAAERSNLVQRIQTLESAQARPMRELAIDPNNEEARAKLTDLEATITKMRKQLQ